MKWILLIQFLSLSIVGFSSVENDFQKACDLYKNKKYDLALKAFKAIEEQGFKGIELYFNIGNCYYKNDDLGYAIAYYEKAKRLDPSDEEIKSNLRLLNAKITDKINFEEKGLSAWLKSVTYIMSADKLSFYGLCLWFAGFIGLILLLVKYLLRGKYYFVAMIICGSILMITGFVQYSMVKSKSNAIVVTSSVQVHANPDTGAKTVYNLHEGTKVNIHEQNGDWFEISIDNENYGWLQKNDLIII